MVMTEHSINRFGLKKNRFFAVWLPVAPNLESRQPVAVAARRNLAEKPDRTGLLNTNDGQPFSKAFFIIKNAAILKSTMTMCMIPGSIFYLFVFLAASLETVWMYFNETRTTYSHVCSGCVWLHSKFGSTEV